MSQAEALESERAATETFLKPLRLQLRDLDDQVQYGRYFYDNDQLLITVSNDHLTNYLDDGRLSPSR